MSESESRALTPAEKQRAKTDALVSAVEQRSEQLSVLLEESGIPFKRFVEVFRRALVQNPDLLQADAGSVIQACMNACTDGLLPDGRQGALVVRSVNIAARGQSKNYAKRASWQPMVQGLLAIAYASGNFKDIQARVVYEGDTWDYELGIDPWIKHKPAPRPARTDATKIPIIAAYAVAKTKDGGVFVEVFEGDDIRKVRAVAAATTGPWASWEEEMTRKGPVRRMWKYLPKNPRMERAVEHDDENFDLDLLEPSAEVAPSLKTGFAPKPAALPQGADPVVDIPMDPEMELVDEAEAASGADDPLVDQSRDVEPEPADRVGERSPNEAQNPRIREYVARLDGAQNWLNIKQALRGLYKAEDWDRTEWERDILARAWMRKEGLKDATDFVTDIWLFAAWLCGEDRGADAIAGNLRVLESQADHKRATAEIQAWISRLATTYTRGDES